MKFIPQLMQDVRPKKGVKVKVIYFGRQKKEKEIVWGI